MSLDRDKYFYYEFGPYDLPKKDKWLVIGSGPSFKNGYEFLANNDNVGIIALNYMVRLFDNVTVNIFNHYEIFIRSAESIKNAQYLYMSNPIHVGYRCLPVDTLNMVNFRRFENETPNKIRLFKPDNNLVYIDEREDSLFMYHTISSSAAHLLHKNNIKKFYCCGIDGGYGSYSKDIKLPEYLREPTNYDRHNLEFHNALKKFKMKVIHV